MLQENAKTFRLQNVTEMELFLLLHRGHGSVFVVVVFCFVGVCQMAPAVFSGLIVMYLLVCRV